MKKLFSTLLIAGAVLVCAPVARATNSYLISMYSPDGAVTMSAVFDFSYTANADGGLSILKVESGTFTDTKTGITGSITTDPLTGSNTTPVATPDNAFTVDNLFYPKANAPATPGVTAEGGYFDGNGIVFYVGTASDPEEWEVNLYSLSGGAYGSFEALTYPTTTYSPYFTTGMTGQETELLTVTQLAPEPSSLLLLGTGLFGLALVVSRSRRLGALIGRR